MPHTIGRNRNTNEAANVNAGIVVNAVTSTKILDANPNRVALHINNNAGIRPCWIKLQDTDTDDIKKGIFLAASNKGISQWDMSPDNIYTGEICAMSDSGTEIIYATEY